MTTDQIIVPGSGRPSSTYWDFFVSGAYYSAQMHQTGNITSSTIGANSMLIAPIIVNKTTSFDRIGVTVGTGQASATIRCGLYRDNGSFEPGVLVAESDELDASTSGLKETVIDVTLKPGVYWLAVITNNSSVTINVTSNSAGVLGTNGGTTHNRSYSASLTYPSSMPDPAPAVSLSTASIRIVVLRAA